MSECRRNSALSFLSDTFTAFSPFKKKKSARDRGYRGVLQVLLTWDVILETDTFTIMEKEA